MNQSKSAIPYRDGLWHLAHVGAALGAQLVRLVALESGNRYLAKALQFRPDGATEVADDATMTVTNLAEPADADGSVPAGTDALALDVEARWVVFVRNVSSYAMFPARIVASLGSAAYTVRGQTPDANGAFRDKDTAEDVTALNLAELSLGPGAAVDNGTIVLVTEIQTTQSSRQHVFDHPAYAKYLD